MEVVEHLKYLGSLVEQLIGEISCRFAQASRAFGIPNNSMYTASDVTLETKRDQEDPICGVASVVVLC